MGELADLRRAEESYRQLRRPDPEGRPQPPGSRLARAALESGRLTEARELYTRLLEDKPQAEAELRLELARTCMALGDTEAAREQLLAAGTEDVDELLRLWAGRAAPWQFSLAAGLRLVLDSNPGLAREASSAAGTSSLSSLDFFYRPGRGEQASPWRFAAQALVYSRSNLGAGLGKTYARFGEWARLAGGARYLAGRSWFDARLRLEGGDHELKRQSLLLGPELSWVYALSEEWHWISTATAERLTYHAVARHAAAYQSSGDWSGKFSQELSGWRAGLGQGTRLYWGGRAQTRHSLTLLLEGGRSWLGSSDYSGARAEASASLSLRPSPELSLGARAGFGLERRPGQGPGQGTNKLITAELTATYELLEWLKLESACAYARALSSGPVQAYRRRTFSLGLSCFF